MPQRILQFGTSRFLQAHVDLMVHQARQSGQDIGPITVVKTSPGTDRDDRVQHLARAEGFAVSIRGLVNGSPVSQDHRVTSIAAALHATQDWARLVALFATGIEIVVSNTAESGFDIAASDRLLAYAAPGIPTSFPGKLLALLAARFASGGQPLLILPCELIAYNGQVLRELLQGLAHDWRAPAPFADWLAASVTVCNTLVDRIVPAEIKPVGAVAEPYALWAIQSQAPLPFTHPAMIRCDDLEPFLRLKLHILNLGHSFLAQTWQSTGRPAAETVRDIMADPVTRRALLQLYDAEVVPGFARHGMEAAARAYVAETIDRFDNPFLAHPLRDIHQNHAIKISRRVAAFVTWVHQKDATLPLPQLEALCAL